MHLPEFDPSPAQRRPLKPEQMLAVRLADGAVGGPVRLRLVGELDAFTAVVLTDALAALRRRRPRVVELDFAGLTFLDTTGLHALASALHVPGAQPRVRLTGPRPQVRRVLDLTYAVGGLPRSLRPAVEQLAATCGHRARRCGRWHRPDATGRPGPGACR